MESSFGEDCVYSHGAIATIRERISATLEPPMQTGAPTGNAADAVFREAVGNNPTYSPFLVGGRLVAPLDQQGPAEPTAAYTLLRIYVGW